MNHIQKLVSIVGFFIRVWKIFDNLWLNWAVHDYLGAIFNVVALFLFCFEKRDAIKTLGVHLKAVSKFVGRIPYFRSICSSNHRKDDAGKK